MYPIAIHLNHSTGPNIRCERCGAYREVRHYPRDRWTLTGISHFCRRCHRTRSVDGNVLRLQRKSRRLLRRVTDQDWEEWVYMLRHAALVLEGAHAVVDDDLRKKISRIRTGLRRLDNRVKP